MDGAICRWAAMLRQPAALLPHSWRWARDGSDGSGPASSSEGTAPPAPGARSCSLAAPAQQASGVLLSHVGSWMRLDYTFDDQLGPLRSRFAAVRLRPAAGLQQLVSSGHAYAERLQAQGVWAAWLAGAAAPPAGCRTAA